MSDSDNFFATTSRLDLAQHCREMRDELRTPRRRTAEQRRALAERCGFLLNALADHLAGGPMSAEWSAAQTAPPYARGLAEAFLELYDQEELHLREHLLQRAAQVAYADGRAHLSSHLVGWSHDDFVRELTELQHVMNDRLAQERGWRLRDVRHTFEGVTTPDARIVHVSVASRPRRQRGLLEQRRDAGRGSRHGCCN